MAEDDPWAEDSEFLMEVMVSAYERRKSQTDTVNAMPLYPTEAILWDENQVPKVHYTGERPSRDLPSWKTAFLQAGVLWRQPHARSNPGCKRGYSCSLSHQL